MVIRRDWQGGQAAVELVAVTPLIVIVVLALAQAAIAGYALWAAGDAARAGARAAHVGGDAERAARSALPSWLEERAQVATSGPVEVRVRAPAVLPGVPPIGVGAATALEPEGASGG